MGIITAFVARRRANAGMYRSWTQDNRRVDLVDIGDPVGGMPEKIRDGAFYLNGKPIEHATSRMPLAIVGSQIAQVQAVSNQDHGFIATKLQFAKSTHLPRGRQTAFEQDVNVETPPAQAFGDLLTISGDSRMALGGGYAVTEPR